MRQVYTRVARLILQRSHQYKIKSTRPLSSTPHFSCKETREKLSTDHDAQPPASAVRLNAQLFESALSKEKRVKAASDDNGNLEVLWSDGTATKYPHVWLRDNCRCDQCYMPSSSSRLLALADLDIDALPADIAVDSEAVNITWNDGHKSRFTSQWLQVRSFADEDQIKRLEFLSPGKPRLWGKEIQNEIPTFDFHQLTTNDRTLYDWIVALETIGLTIIKNTPCETGQINKIAERVEMLRENHYGKNFTVKAKLDPSNLAYTPSSLGLHTDLPYYYYTPGMQMLHCIKQVPTEGGENQFSDGFNAAYILKKRHPEMFELLKALPFDYKDIGEDKCSFFKRTRLAVISCDPDGSVSKITFNNMVRDDFLHLPLDMVTKVYTAMKTFNNIMYEPENHIIYKLEEGDITCFHNYRVLHGRTSYNLIMDGVRHLEGGYIDWDELNSRRRVLMLELGLFKSD